MWDSLVKNGSLDVIMNDKGLAKLGDAFVNLCYSLAKSIVIGTPTGAKVRDRVLANAIRETSIYRHIGHRTDVGSAGDAYEAIMAYLWVSGKIDLEGTVSVLAGLLKPELNPNTGRKQEIEISTKAFRVLLDEYISDHLVNMFNGTRHNP